MKYWLVSLILLFGAGCVSGTSQKFSSNSFYTPKSWNKPIEKTANIIDSKPIEKKANVVGSIPVEKVFSSSTKLPSDDSAVEHSFKEQMIGYASWYGPGFHGKQTANGEVYDQNNMTAAHKLLPLNTWVRVKNLDNGKSVPLRINDRGPYKKNRIIDLSLKAAKILGYAKEGTARVKIEVIKFPPNFDPEKGSRPYKQVVVQVAVFKSEENARRLKQKLTQRFSAFPFIVDQNLKGSYHVISGPFDLRKKAVFVASKLESEGVDNFVRSYRK